jgi:endonuclease/exonuclease/phosphatase family metal-dependent hydrolase
MSTYGQTHQIIIGGDFNEEITNINTTARHQYVVEFMAEHQMYTKEMGPTFINAKEKDCTSVDYILFQESYREQISSIKKIDVIANVSDHYPILLALKYKKSIDKIQNPAHTQRQKLNGIGQTRTHM